MMNFVHYQITFLINSNAPLLHWQSASKAKSLSVNVNSDLQRATTDNRRAGLCLALLID